MFNLIQHFVHLNLSIALLLGLIIFVSGIETASEYRVSHNIRYQMYMDFSFLRKVVLLWLYCFTISSWQHFAGCSVKECCYLLCCILYFIKDFLKAKGFILQLGGVRKHKYSIHYIAYLMLCILYVAHPHSYVINKQCDTLKNKSESILRHKSLIFYESITSIFFKTTYVAKHHAIQNSIIKLKF